MGDVSKNDRVVIGARARLPEASLHGVVVHEHRALTNVHFRHANTETVVGS
jgi:hypothetical protein